VNPGLSVGMPAEGVLQEKTCMRETCVLAYSGGLDTSVILGWLIEQGHEVVAVYVDLGQPCEDREAILRKARDCGAVEALIVDVREDLCRDFAFPVMQWQARYEGTYLLGTSIARPLIARVCVDVARQRGARIFAHGATGKGNDQCRFQLAAEALDPGIRVLAPWRIAGFRDRFPGRQELIEFCAARRIPVKASKGKPYSSDENCLHTSYEAGLLEDLATDGFGLVEFGMTVSPQAAPERPETVTIDFEAGVPVALDGRPLRAHEIVLALNEIGGRNGVGRTDIVENRLVGMKSRGVYETPGGTILCVAHQGLEQITLDRDTLHYKDVVAQRYAEVVYNGQWFTPLREALEAFFDATQQHVTGTARIKLYKGNASLVGRKAARGLYNPDIASFTMSESYNQQDAAGFITIFGLPIKLQALTDGR